MWLSAFGIVFILNTRCLTAEKPTTTKCPFILKPTASDANLAPGVQKFKLGCLKVKYLNRLIFIRNEFVSVKCFRMCVIIKFCPCKGVKIEH